LADCFIVMEMTREKYFTIELVGSSCALVTLEKGLLEPVIQSEVIRVVLWKNV